MTTSTPNACRTCVHFKTKVYDGPALCDAFPSAPGIPEEIWYGENGHTTPVEGDNGIQFELLEGMDEFYQNYLDFREAVSRG